MSRTTRAHTPPFSTYGKRVAMIPVEKMIYAVWITMAVLGTAFLIGGTVIAVHFLAKVW